MTDRTSRQYTPDIVEIATAAKLARVGVFTDGQRIGTDPNGFPVWCKRGTVVVDMRPHPADVLPEDTAMHQRVQPVLVGMAPERRSRSRKGGWK